ncbi:MAG: phosphoglucosamine mutase [Halanaerobiales bacterium]
MGNIFGTDGVRGLANRDITGELAYRLARAAGYFLLQRYNKKKRPKIIVGKDTRLSGDMLESALNAGFNSVGIDVLKLGIIPTPGVAYLTDYLDVIGGVMISASHNPIGDNGIKLFDKKGYKLTDKMENEIEILFTDNYNDLPYPTHRNIGSIEKDLSLVKKYEEHLLNTVYNRLDDLKIVIDCAHGAAYRVSPNVLKKLGAELIVMNDSPAGEKINVNCGSTYPHGVAQRVKETGADLGIAHDGDADRVIMVDNKGEVVDGDVVMAICALDMLEKGELNANTLVTTRYSNLGLKEVLEKEGGRVELAANGDRYVLKKMKENNYNLGGEKSGHIIFLDYNQTGDGLLTALQLTQILVENNESLHSMSKVMKAWPQKLTNIEVSNKEKWKSNHVIQKEIKKAKEDFGSNGRVFVRASGTEPVIRLMLESKEEYLLDIWEKRLKKVIKKELN